MFASQYTQPSEDLKAFIQQHIEPMSRATKFVQRQSKLNGTLFVLALVSSWLERPSASLNDIAQSCAQMGVDISEAGLQQRMTWRAVALLQGLFEAALRRLPKAKRLPDGVLANFRAVYLLDSTLISLPNKLSHLCAGFGGSASAAAVKLRLSFDYCSGRIAALEVLPGTAADQACQQHLELAQPGSLHVFDLGFFKVSVFERLAAAQAYFISRLQSQTALYSLTQPQQRVDLPRLLCGVQGGEIELALGQQARLPVRLVYARVPPAVAQERRRKARRAAAKHGQQLSVRALALLDWSLFITNVPRAWLSTDHIALVYGVRWQIELVFKLWKSQALLDQVGQCGPVRFLCQLYARLLGLVFFHWLLTGVPLDPERERSLPKAFAILQRHAARLREALTGAADVLPALLAKLDKDFQRFARQQHRRQKPSTLARLLAAHA